MPTLTYSLLTSQSLCLDPSICFPALALALCFQVQDVKIDPSNGIPFLPDAPGLKYLEQGAPISLAAHGGPWYLHEAISSSPHVTTDIDEADIVYVYDFCYYARWLGQVRGQLCNSFAKDSSMLPAGPCKLLHGESKQHLAIRPSVPRMAIRFKSGSVLAVSESVQSSLVPRALETLYCGCGRTSRMPTKTLLCSTGTHLRGQVCHTG